MQRAQRAADSPLRAILEAAKVRRRFEPDTPAQTDAAPRRATALRPPAPPPAAAAATETASSPRAEPRAVAATPPAATAAAAAAAQAVEPAAPAAVVIRTLPGGALPATPGRSAGLETSAVSPLRAASAPLMPAELPQIPLAADNTPQRPSIVHIVEPEVPQRLLSLLSRPEVIVEFTIRADGTVAGVTVLPPAPRQMVPILVGAIEQWRYAPQPAPRQHRVLLVFKDSP